MLMNSLSIIVRHSRTFSERKMQTFDVGFPEQLVLMYLSTNDNINQDTIAKYYMIDKGAIAKTLGKLEKKGLIKRYENQENKREKLILLLPKGRDIIKHMDNVLNEWNESLFCGLSENDIKELERITGIMANNVAKVMDEGGIDFNDKDE